MLEGWIRAATSILKPDGRLIVIFRADGLNTLVSSIANRFGDIAILPIHPRAKLVAKRILVRAVKGSRAPQRILPGLALHQPRGNAYLEPVERILRDGVGLAEVHPSWSEGAV